MVVITRRRAKWRGVGREEGAERRELSFVS